MSIPVRIDAMSWSVPTTASAHPNRMPMTGVLTLVDTPSLHPPSGSPGGRRIVLSKAAAQAAISTLIGMPVRLEHGTHAIGTITAARVDGSAVRIEAEIWKDSYPAEARRIKDDQSSLGLSFEANVSFRDNNAAILTIDRCVFTGCAAVKEAAFAMTSLAASAAKEHRPMPIIERIRAEGGRVTVGSKDRVVGTAAPDPLLVAAMLKVGIEASSIDDTGRLTVAQLEKIKATTDSISRRMQLTRLAELAGLLPVELQPRSPALSAF